MKLLALGSCAASLTAFVLVACSVEPIVPDFGDLPDGAGDAGGSRITEEAGKTPPRPEEDAGSAPPPPKPAYVRLVHGGFQTGGIDLCLKPTAGATIGPVLAGVGLRTGVEEGSVTNHVEVPLGSYEASVISDGGTCDAARPVAKVSFEVTSGSVTTLALWGNGGTSDSALVALADDAAPSPTALRARFVNLLSSVSAPVDVFGTDAAPGSAPLFPAVAPGSVPKTANGGTLGKDGYLDDAASKVGELTALYRPSSSSTAQREAYADIDQKVGAASGFLVGYPGSGFFPVHGLACDDAVTPLTKEAPLARCQRR